MVEIWHTLQLKSNTCVYINGFYNWYTKVHVHNTIGSSYKDLAASVCLSFKQWNSLKDVTLLTTSMKTKSKDVGLSFTWHCICKSRDSMLSIRFVSACTYQSLTYECQTWEVYMFTTYRQVGEILETLTYHLCTPCRKLFTSGTERIVKRCHTIVVH